MCVVHACRRAWGILSWAEFSTVLGMWYRYTDVGMLASVLHPHPHTALPWKWEDLAYPVLQWLELGEDWTFLQLYITSSPPASNTGDSYPCQSGSPKNQNQEEVRWQRQDKETGKERDGDKETEIKRWDREIYRARDRNRRRDRGGGRERRWEADLKDSWAWASLKSQGRSRTQAAANCSWVSPSCGNLALLWRPFCRLDEGYPHYGGESPRLTHLPVGVNHSYKTPSQQHLYYY